MSEIIPTETIKHKKFTIPIPWNNKSNVDVTYYVAEIKTEHFRGSSDFQIHRKIDGDADGYGGATLQFLMCDGTIEKVKGPYYQYSEQHPRILWDILTGERWS